jgi:hypothetical protein
LDVTDTVIEQVEAGAMVPLFSVTEVPPGLAVNEAVPPQPAREGETGLARKTLAGRESIRDAWVRLVAGRLFLMVIVKRLVAPAHIVPGLKLLFTSGVGLAVTLRVALAGLVLLMFVPPPVELRAPTEMVLIKLPGVTEVTLTETVHDPGVEPDCAGTVPPLNVMEVLVVETFPPHVSLMPAGLATLRPCCTPTKLSVQDALVSINILGLKMVMLRTDISPAKMEIGVNFLLISAGRVIA